MQTIRFLLDGLQGRSEQQQAMGLMLKLNLYRNWGHRLWRDLLHYNNRLQGQPELLGRDFTELLKKTLSMQTYSAVLIGILCLYLSCGRSSPMPRMQEICLLQSSLRWNMEIAKQVLEERFGLVCSRRAKFESGCILKGPQDFQSISFWESKLDPWKLTLQKACRSLRYYWTQDSEGIPIPREDILCWKIYFLCM